MYTLTNKSSGLYSRGNITDCFSSSFESNRYNNMMLSADVVVVPSYFMAEYILENYASSERDIDSISHKIEVIPRGIDTDVGNPK